MQNNELIISIPTVYNGEPHVKGLSLKISILRDWIDKGKSRQQILDMYADMRLTQEELEAALSYVPPTVVIPQTPQVLEPIGVVRRRRSAAGRSHTGVPIPSEVNCNYFIAYKLSNVTTIKSTFINIPYKINSIDSLVQVSTQLLGRERISNPQLTSPNSTITVINFQLIEE